MTINKRRIVWAIGFVAFLALTMVYGRILSRLGRLDSPSLAIQDVILGLLFFAVATIAMYFILRWIESCAAAKAIKAAAPKDRIVQFNTKRRLVLWLIIFAAWIPILLAYWPTIWAYDVYHQMPLETGTQFYANHPLLHTLFLEAGISLGKILGGGYELGMVILSLLQMLIMAGIFSWTVEKTRALGAHRYLSYALLGFFIFMPFNPILALSQTKDTMFSGFFLVLFILHCEALKAESLTIKRALVIGVISVLMLLLRNNAVYAYSVWLIISAIAPGRKKRMYLTILGCACLAIALALNAVLFVCLDAKKGQPEEAYSVPIQCLTRIAALNPEYVTEYGKGNLMFDGLVLRDEFPEKFSSVYQPANADSPKAAWKRSDEKRGDFNNIALLKEWVILSAKHPKDSFIAWSLLTKGSWYPLDKSHCHVYDYRTNLERQGYLLTDYKIFDGMDDPRPASKFPAFEVLLEKVATNNIHHNSRITTLLLAPASYLWLLLLTVYIAIYQRRSVFPFALILLYFGTILLGPLIIVRYMYPVMLIAPVAAVLTLVSILEPESS